MLNRLKRTLDYMIDMNLRLFQDTLPTGAGPTQATANVAAWTYGAYAQIIAATTVDLWVVGVQLSGVATVDTLHEVAIAVGAGAAEVDFGVFPYSDNDANSTATFGLPYPVKVPTGTRLACRARNTGAAATAIGVKLLVAYFI